MRSPRLKRAIDVVVSGVALAVAAVPMAVIAVCIRATMGKPVLFRQVRPGLHGQPFTLVKFRTMRSGEGSDAERLTRLGAFLRSTSLDELPELWNVLRGEKSLVGPRPLPTKYLSRYTAAESRRHDVRPGLTGWAQINGRASLPWHERIELDLWYVEHATLALDLRIILATIRILLTGHGLYRGETGGWREPPR